MLCNGSREGGVRICGRSNYADAKVSKEWRESDRGSWQAPGNAPQLRQILLQCKFFVIVIKLTILNMVLCAM